MELRARLKTANDKLTGGASVSDGRVVGVCNRNLDAACLSELVLAQVLQLETTLSVLTIQVEERRSVKADEDTLLRTLTARLIPRQLAQGRLDRADVVHLEAI